MDAIKILGSLLSSGAVSSGSGASILKSVIGMAAGGSGGSGGGLGGLLGGLMGGGNANPSSNLSSGGGSDLGSMLGSLLGGGQGSGGGQNAGIGGLLGAALGQYTQSQQADTAPTRSDQCDHLPEGLSQTDASSQATLLIRAMINAAKADGRVDPGEQEKIVGRLGKVDQDDIAWLKQELGEPLNVGRFAASVPRGMEQQVYAMSLMSIDLDTNQEAQYLHELAQGMGVSQQLCNQIHQQFGVRQLYS